MKRILPHFPARWLSWSAAINLLMIPTGSVMAGPGSGLSFADAAFRTGRITNLVTTLADGGPGSLRQAIRDSVNGEVILVDTQGTIVLTTGELVITNDLVIQGPGATNLVLSGNHTSRVLNIGNSNAAVSISGLTVRDGKAPDGPAGAGTGGPGIAGADGGGILNLGTLSLSNCVITANRAGSGGKGADGATTMHGSLDGGIGGSGGNGGGIFNSGALALTACNLSANGAGSGGSGGSDGGSLNPGYDDPNQGGTGGRGGSGGGIFNSGTLTVTACRLSANVAGPGGQGGYAYVGGGWGGSGGSGGGIQSSSSGPLTLAACTLSDNAGGSGGVGGTGDNNGGQGGSGGSGGGIQGSGSGALTLTACTLSANVAGSAGQGGHAHPMDWYGGGGWGGDGGPGGGIHSSGSGLLTLSVCTVISNVAGLGGDAGVSSFGGGEGGGGGSGGGIYLSGPGALTLIACTVCANSAAAGGSGPGINQAAGGNGGNGGGICRVGGGRSRLHSSLVSMNSSGAGGAGSPSLPFSPGPGKNGLTGSGRDLYGLFTSLGHNLISQGDGAVGLVNGVLSDLVGSTNSPIDARLGPLADHGGPTFTAVPSLDSPALEAGDDSLLQTLATDQRGFPREAGRHVDIGAVELQIPSALTLPGAVGEVSGLTAITELTLKASVTFANMPGAAFFQFGLTTNYGGMTPTLPFPEAAAAAPFSTVLSFSRGATCHYRAVVTNDLGICYGADQALAVPALFQPGDLDGDGVVDANEMRAVAQSFWATSPPRVTSLTGSGQGGFQFALSNAVGLDFSVLASTNLVHWQVLSNVAPRLQFSDPDSAKYPERFYRLRWSE